MAEISYTLANKPDLGLILDRIRNKRKRAGVEEELARLFPGQTLRAKIHHVEHHLCHLAAAKRLPRLPAWAIIGAKKPHGTAMTTVEIKIPDSLAKEARQAGLLTPQALETMLRERLRAQHIGELRDAVKQMASGGGAPMTMEEIEAEIQAYRKERRRASGA